MSTKSVVRPFLPSLISSLKKGTALGLHGEHAPHQQNQTQSSGGAVFSQYLKQHLLPQIFFDLWPIALGTLFICVVERGTILNGSNTAWIGIFQILFEATSAYGTIGISYDNPLVFLRTSFRRSLHLFIHPSSAMHPNTRRPCIDLSKWRCTHTSLRLPADVIEVDS